MEAAERAVGTMLRPAHDHHRLRAGEVHIWLAPLSMPSGALTELRRSLASDELARADRLRLPRDRSDFLAAHGMLRLLLASYGAGAPHEVRFEIGSSGKPALEGGPRTGPLRFNMSHSRGAAIYGVTIDREVGVDIEWELAPLNDETAWEEILAPAERTMLDALPSGQRAKALFRLWTLKEALLKARGEGLSLPPRLIDMSAVPAGPPRIISHGERTLDDARWTLRCLPAFPGYAAAAACEGSGCRFVCRRLPVFSGRGAS